MSLTDQERYYFRSIARNLKELQTLAAPLSLGSEALSDNRDWLECWMEEHAPGSTDDLHPAPPPEPEKSKKYRTGLKLFWDHVEWGTNDFIYPERFYYFYWFSWNKKEHRKWGYYKTWYDGPHVVLQLWFFAMSWSTYWTKYKDDYHEQ